MKHFVLIIILTSLFISIPTQGIYQYYFYDEKKVRIPDATFKRYVVTQLRSIISEYYHIIRKINHKMSPVIGIKDNLISLKSMWFTFENSCSEVNEKCDQLLQKIYDTSKSIDSKILRFQDESISLARKQDDVDNWLQIISFSNQIANLNYRHLHRLEEIFIISNNEYVNYEANSKYLYELSHKMLLLTSMIFITSLDAKYKHHFDDFQIGFVKNIETFIIKNLDQEFFVKKLGYFNLSWNSFHMKLSKGTIKLPGKTHQTMGIMHNRWNSILKLFLKRTSFVSSKEVPKATVTEKPRKNWRLKNKKPSVKEKNKDKKIIPTKPIGTAATALKPANSSQKSTLSKPQPTDTKPAGTSPK